MYGVVWDTLHGGRYGVVMVKYLIWWTVWYFVRWTVRYGSPFEKRYGRGTSLARRYGMVPRTGGGTVRKPARWAVWYGISHCLRTSYCWQYGRIPLAVDGMLCRNLCHIVRDTVGGMVRRAVYISWYGTKPRTVDRRLPRKVVVDNACCRLLALLCAMEVIMLLVLRKGSLLPWLPLARAWRRSAYLFQG